MPGTQGGPEDHDLTANEVADGLWLMAAIAANTAEPPPPAEPPVSPYRPEPPETGRAHPPPMEEPGRAGAGPPPDLPEPAPIRTGTGQGVLPAGGGPGTEETPTPGTASPLPDVGKLVRAFRAFKRKVPSTQPEDVELDEEQTAEVSAEAGVWLPVTRRKRQPWLDLTLVVEQAPSMALWAPTVAAFVTLCQRRLGVFRSVQVRLLETGKAGRAEGGMVLEPVLRGGTPESPARGAGEPVGSSGRRVMLVLTDGLERAEPTGDSIAVPVLNWGNAGFAGGRRSSPAGRTSRGSVRSRRLATIRRYLFPSRVTIRSRRMMRSPLRTG